MTAPGVAASLLGDLERAFEEVARSALGAADLQISERHATPIPGYHGAYLGLIGPGTSVQIGLAAEEAGCQELAKRLMGMSAEDPPLPPEEVADAICEVVNIVAGGFKSRVRDRVHPLQMGLPAFFRGGVQPTGHTQVEVAELLLDGLKGALILVHPREAAEP